MNTISLKPKVGMLLFEPFAIVNLSLQSESGYFTSAKVISAFA